jgi:hypothetical protein
MGGFKPGKNIRVSLSMTKKPHAKTQRRKARRKNLLNGSEEGGTGYSTGPSCPYPVYGYLKLFKFKSLTLNLEL